MRPPPRRERFLGTVEQRWIVKNTYENETSANLVCKKKSMRRGAGHLPDVSMGESRVVVILSNIRGGPSGAGAEARAVPGNG